MSIESLVTVIIPIYNVELYLEDCIESVINQTYRNLEIILVDDGSPDNCGKICDSYSRKDNRIIVIHQSNKGLSAARNAGLDLAKGRYVYFLDSDDFIALDLIETYLDLSVKSGADIVCGNYISFWGDIKKDSLHKSYPLKEFSDTQIIKELFSGANINHSAAGPLIKMELFKGIRFPEGVFYEDLAVMYYVSERVKKWIYVDDRRYFYRNNPCSILHSDFDERHYFLLEITNEITDYTINKHPELLEAAIVFKLNMYSSLYEHILRGGYNSYEDIQNDIREIIKKNSVVYLKSAIPSYRKKIKILLATHTKLLFYICRVLLK